MLVATLQSPETVLAQLADTLFAPPAASADELPQCSDAQSARLAALFKRWDGDQSGRLSGAELVATLRSLNELTPSGQGEVPGPDRPRPERHLLNDATVRTLLAFLFLHDHDGCGRE